MTQWKLDSLVLKTNDAEYSSVGKRKFRLLVHIARTRVTYAALTWKFTKTTVYKLPLIQIGSAKDRSFPGHWRKHKKSLAEILWTNWVAIFKKFYLNLTLSIKYRIVYLYLLIQRFSFYKCTCTFVLKANILKIRSPRNACCSVHFVWFYSFRLYFQSKF